MKGSRQEAFLTKEEFAYWNDNYKVSNETFKFSSPEMMSLTEQSPRRSPSKCYSIATGRQQTNEPRHISFADWLPWQNTLQPTGPISNSTKTQAFVEDVKFIELQNEMSNNDDLYGREMALFLNKDDVLDVPHGTIMETLRDGHDKSEVNIGADNVTAQEAGQATGSSDDDLPVYDCFGSTVNNKKLNLNKTDEEPNSSAGIHAVDADVSYQEVADDFPLIRSPPSASEMFDDEREELSPVDIMEIIEKATSGLKADGEVMIQKSAAMTSDFTQQKVENSNDVLDQFQNDFFDDDDDDSFLLRACNLPSVESEKPKPEAGIETKIESLKTFIKKITSVSADEEFNRTKSCTMTQLLELANEETQDLLHAEQNLLSPKQPPFSKKSSESLDSNDDFVPPSPLAPSKLSKLRSSQGVASLKAMPHRKTFVYRTKSAMPSTSKQNVLSELTENTTSATKENKPFETSVHNQTADKMAKADDGLENIRHADDCGESLFNDSDDDLFLLADQKILTTDFKVPDDPAHFSPKIAAAVRCRNMSSPIGKPVTEFAIPFSPDDDFASPLQPVNLLARKKKSFLSDGTCYLFQIFYLLMEIHGHL